MAHEKLLKMLEKAIKIEDKAVELYGETTLMIENVAVKLLIESMRMDSAKHARIYRTIKRVLEETPYSLKDFHVERWVDKLVAKRELAEHIKAEEDMIALLEETIPKIEQKTIKALLEHVLEDEKRHHAMLKKDILNV